MRIKLLPRDNAELKGTPINHKSRSQASYVLQLREPTVPAIANKTNHFPHARLIHSCNPVLWESLVPING